MKIIETQISGVLLIKPEIYGDNRGFFTETWNQDRYSQRGIAAKFVQDGLSYSEKGVLRGLHAQFNKSQGKLIQVQNGRVFDVVVDLRHGSATLGKSLSFELDSEFKHQLYIPPGFAHGFAVLSESALVAYKCTDFYDANAEFTLLWNDPDLDIDWPLENPLVSQKDKAGLRLRNLPDKFLYRGTIFK